MGIRYLNKYLLSKCKRKSIEKKFISSLQDKFVVIDTSIYMYKYKSQQLLHENFYSMIHLFHKYNITPLFIFDGKPPLEKKDELTRRQEEKRNAELQFNVLNDELEEIQNEKERATLLLQMDKLKQQFIRVSEKDINSVKEIMNAFGVQYYDAIGEADKICGLITTHKRCYACISDDMDMFIYGCKRIIRDFNIENETFLEYNLNSILDDIDMSFILFKQVVLLSGTDYNIYDNNISLNETLKWLKEYQKYIEFQDSSNSKGFYEWLINNTKYISNYQSLLKIHEMFTTNNVSDINIDNVCLNKNYQESVLQNIMKEYGFMFV